MARGVVGAEKRKNVAACMYITRRKKAAFDGKRGVLNRRRVNFRGNDGDGVALLKSRQYRHRQDRRGTAA